MLLKGIEGYERGETQLGGRESTVSIIIIGAEMVTSNRNIEISVFLRTNVSKDTGKDLIPILKKAHLQSVHGQLWQALFSGEVQDHHHGNVTNRNVGRAATRKSGRLL